MVSLNVTIHTLEDTEPILKKTDKVKEADKVRFAILEQGMASGKAAIVICLETADGETMFGQISEGNMEQFKQVFEGAKLRFSDLRAEREEEG